MERQFGPFKKGDLVRFRHQEGQKAIGVVVSSIEYLDSLGRPSRNSFCWVAWNFLNGERGRNTWTMLERIQ